MWSAGRLAQQLQLYLDIDLRHWMCDIQKAAGCCRNNTQQKKRVSFRSESVNRHKAHNFLNFKNEINYSDVHWQNCGNSSMSHVCCSGVPWGGRRNFFGWFQCLFFISEFTFSVVGISLLICFSSSNGKLKKVSGLTCPWHVDMHRPSRRNMFPGRVGSFSAPFLGGHVFFGESGFTIKSLHALVVIGLLAKSYHRIENRR